MEIHIKSTFGRKNLTLKNVDLNMKTIIILLVICTGCTSNIIDLNEGFTIEFNSITQKYGLHYKKENIIPNINIICYLSSNEYIILKTESNGYHYIVLNKEKVKNEYGHSTISYDIYLSENDISNKLKVSKRNMKWKKCW